MGYSEDFHKVVNALCCASGLDRDTAEYAVELFMIQAQDLMNTIEIYTSREPSENEYLQMAALFHKLKGSAGNVRAENIMQSCIHAEIACQTKELETIKNHAKQIKLTLCGYRNQLFI